MNWKKFALVTTAAVIIQACSSTTTYKVRPGDTLSTIARNHKMSVSQLQNMNNIANPNHIKVGQLLTVSGKGGTPVRSSSSAKATTGAPTPIVRRDNTIVTPKAPAAPKDKVQTGITGWIKPTNGAVVKSYNPNIPGQKGIQIAGSSGQRINAAHKGDVVYAGSGNAGYGQLIIIKHNSNTYSAYGYLASITVREGMKVNKGQQIATMGESSDGRTVLYFEIRTKGQTVNPMNYIQ